MVALICKWTYFKVKSNVTWFDLDYADFVNKPEESLENLEKTLCVDTQGIIGLIKSHEKLEVGPLFDGNRIRLKSDLELKPTSKVVSMDFKDRFVRIFNYPFYH